MLHDLERHSATCWLVRRRFSAMPSVSPYTSYSIIINSKTHYNILPMNFNTKVGLGEIRETSTGSYGIGIRNRRGGILVEFAKWHKFRIVNIFFFKKRPNIRWLWICLTGATKNNIDYITTDRADIFLDASVINSLNTGTDHCMIRGNQGLTPCFREQKWSPSPKRYR